jgi:GT2 family glycosyltransferase
LNWNGARDTIDCIQSLFPVLEKEDYLFVIDNGSDDGSVVTIREYLQMKGTTFRNAATSQFEQVFDEETSVYLIENTKNFGFAAGLNPVLKKLYHLKKDFKFVWCINNDAIIDEHTLKTLKAACQADRSVAVAGSLILNYPDKVTVQCSGVKHYAFLGVSKLINKNLPLTQFDPGREINFDYLNGASLLFRLEAVNKVGYFDETFFLYSEEFDLQIRLKEAGYHLKLVTDSRVWHRLSGSTSGSRHFFYFHYNRSAVIVTKKHYNILVLILATLSLIVITFVRTFPRGREFFWGLKGIWKGLKNT